MNEFPQLCRDCGEVMDVVKQPRWNGGHIDLCTCWTAGCLLHGVTLSIDQYNGLTETQLSEYRQVNRNAWRPAHGFAASVSGEAGR